MIGVVPQETALYNDLTAQENLLFHARLYNVPSGERTARIAEVLDLVGLTARQHDRVGTYSGGMQRRLALARAVNTGLQVASEWNDRTVKMVLLAPVSRSVLIAGKVVAGLGQSLLGVALVVLTLVIGFHFRPAGSLWAMAGVMFVVMLLGAGIGAMTGVASKQTLAVTSILIALSVMLFLISGNEDSLRGLAWSGPIVALWQLARLLPTTYAFLVARTLLLTGDATTLARDLLVVFLTMIIVLTGAAALLRRAYTQLPEGQ